MHVKIFWGSKRRSELARTLIMQRHDVLTYALALHLPNFVSLPRTSASGKVPERPSFPILSPLKSDIFHTLSTFCPVSKELCPTPYTSKTATRCELQVMVEVSFGAQNNVLRSGKRVMFGIVPVIWLCLMSRPVNLVRLYISEGKVPVMNCIETLKCSGKTIVREIQRKRTFAHFS